MSGVVVAVLVCALAIGNGLRQAHDTRLWSAAPAQPPAGHPRAPPPGDARLDAHFAQCVTLRASCVLAPRAACRKGAERSVLWLPLPLSASAPGL
jgi:hypothetical protein